MAGVDENNAAATWRQQVLVMHGVGAPESSRWERASRVPQRVVRGHSLYHTIEGCGSIWAAHATSHQYKPQREENTGRLNDV